MVSSLENTKKQKVKRFNFMFRLDKLTFQTLFFFWFFKQLDPMRLRRFDSNYILIYTVTYAEIRFKRWVYINFFYGLKREKKIFEIFEWVWRRQSLIFVAEYIYKYKSNYRVFVFLERVGGLWWRHPFVKSAKMFLIRL